MREGDKRIGTPLLVGLAVLGILGAALVTFFDGWNPIALDYGVFWESARRSLNEIYQFRVGSVYAYPPTLIPLLEPLAFLPFWTGYVLWTALSALAFFFAARRFIDARTTAIAMFSSASVQNLLLGQTPMFLAAGLLFAVSLQSSLLSGATIGFLAAIKPQIFVMAPVVIAIRRDWRALGGIIVGALASALATVAMYGIQPWLDWVEAIPHFQRAIVDLHVVRHVITLTAIASLLRLNSTPLFLAGTCIALFAVVRLSRRAEGVHLAALIVGASILSTPYALPHDLVGAMPALAAFIVSAPVLAEFTLAVMIFAGLGLPIFLPAAALISALRLGSGWRSERQVTGRAIRSWASIIARAAKCFAKCITRNLVPGTK